MTNQLFVNFFQNSKMAIPEYKNGHFEEIGGWSQILQIIGNSPLLYLSFDTHDSPGSIFIWKWENFSPHLLVWQDESFSSLNNSNVLSLEKINLATSLLIRKRIQHAAFYKQSGC